MTTITIERTILDRLIEAWDSTVLPTHRDGMMQERMEDLRAELAKPAPTPAWHDTPGVAWKATSLTGDTAHFGVRSAAKAWARSGTVAPVRIRDLRLVPTPDVPCKTCEALSRDLLEQAPEKLLDYWPKSDPCINGIRTALAAPDDVAEEMSAVADQYAHKLALDLECVLADYSGTWYDAAIGTLGAYREAMNAIHERQSPTFMGEPVIRPTQAAPSTDDRYAQELLAQDITLRNMQARHAQELCAYQITVDKLRAERKPMIAADIDAEARKAGASAYTNRFVAGSAFSFGPEALERFVRAVEAHHGIGEQS